MGEGPAGAGRLDPAAGFAWLWEWRRRLIKPLLAAAAAVWIASGVYVVEPEQLGVIERFGRKIEPYREPGLHYKLPSPIETLTRVDARRVRVLEIGFRTIPAMEFDEPPAYEWNVQHRGGMLQFQPEESLLLTGDQNMVEAHIVVHYVLEDPGDFLFEQLNPETTIRVAAESVMRTIVNQTALDDLLTTERRGIEQWAAEYLQKRLERYRTGTRVLAVRLQDVHPSVEVVDAFREVAGAIEEKSRRINEAEGYRNERVALARGQAEARARQAVAYKATRVNRASGDAARFTRLERAYRAAPETTRTRLYLETIEEVLPKRRKLILDPRARGRRGVYSIEDGVELAPAGAAIAAPPLALPIPREEP